MTSDPNGDAGVTPPATDPSPGVTPTTAAGATPAGTEPPAVPAASPAGATPPAEDGKDALIAKFRAAEKETAAKLKRLADLEKAEAERDEAAKTEQQKLEERTTAAETRAAKAEADALQLRTERAFEARARELGMTARLAPALAAIGTLDLATDGSIADLDAKIEALKTSDPYLFGTTAAPVAAPGNLNPGGGNTPQGAVTLTQEQLDMAKRSGITPEQYAAQLPPT